MIDLLDNDERFIAQLGIGWMVRLRKKTRQGKGGRGLVMMGWFEDGMVRPRDNMEGCFTRLHSLMHSLMYSLMMYSLLLFVIPPYLGQLVPAPTFVERLVR